jgi:cell division protein FtsB
LTLDIHLVRDQYFFLNIGDDQWFFWQARVVRNIILGFQKWLERPVKVAAVMIVVAFCSLLAGGTFWDLYNLSREKTKIRRHLDQTVRDNNQLQSKIKQARTSDKFIGRQARETLNLVKEDELVFIFETDDLFETLSTQR